MKTQDYYDEFAGWYERERGHGYHQLIDDLESELVERHGSDRSVLEVGCGTGLILARAARVASDAWGVDLSAGMLAHARARGLNVVQGSASELPFVSERFDCVYSFKVLAHVERIREACAEMARVTRPGGHMLLEFYNPWSLRYLVKRLKPPTSISAQTTDEAVYTRYDTLAAAESYLPAGVELVGVRGVRIATPSAAVFRIPGAAALFTRAEKLLADAPGFRRLGGFLIVIARKSAE